LDWFSGSFAQGLLSAISGHHHGGIVCLTLSEINNPSSPKILGAPWPPLCRTPTQPQTGEARVPYQALSEGEGHVRQGDQGAEEGGKRLNKSPGERLTPIFWGFVVSGKTTWRVVLVEAAGIEPATGGYSIAKV
jgi:hypothetical protein